MRQIAENAGVDGAIVVGKLLEAKDTNYGFDAQTGEYVDMVKAGIIDPTKVVRMALQDAASVAGLLITTEAMVAEKPEKKPRRRCRAAAAWAAWATWTSKSSVTRQSATGRPPSGGLLFLCARSGRAIWVVMLALVALVARMTVQTGRSACAGFKKARVCSTASANPMRCTATPGGKAPKRRVGRRGSSSTKTPRSSARRTSRPKACFSLQPRQHVVIGGAAERCAPRLVQDVGPRPGHAVEDDEPQRAARHVDAVAHRIGAEQAGVLLGAEDVDQRRGLHAHRHAGPERNAGLAPAARRSAHAPRAAGGWR